VTVLWPVIWVACSDQQFMKQIKVLWTVLFLVFFNFCGFKSLAIFSFSNYFWIYTETTKVSNNWESTTIKTLVTLCKRPPQSPPNLLDTPHNGLAMVLSGDCRKYHPIYVTSFSVLFRHSFRLLPSWARQPSSAGSTFRAASFSCKVSSLVENMLEMWINSGDNWSPTVTGENPMPTYRNHICHTKLLHFYVEFALWNPFHNT